MENRFVENVITHASNLVINESYFIFNSKFYKQKQRVSLGSTFLSNFAQNKKIIKPCNGCNIELLRYYGIFKCYKNLVIKYEDIKISLKTLIK